MKCRSTLVAMRLLILVAGAVSDSAGRALDIDIMSFNIRHATDVDGGNRWALRRELACDVIRRHAPAVVGLQEALHTQLDDLQQCLPEYAQRGVGRDGGTGGEYAAILYRADRFRAEDSGTFWLSETPDMPSVHWGNACIRICTWVRLVGRPSGPAFYVFNTHLDHESQPSREKSVRLIASTIHARAHPDPFLLVGDFNAGEDNPAIRYLTTMRQGPDRTPVAMIDAYRRIHPDAAGVGTFNRFAGQSDGPKIDYIFVEPATSVLAAGIDRTAVGGRYPSDHFPVFARVRLAIPAPPSSADLDAASP